MDTSTFITILEITDAADTGVGNDAIETSGTFVH